MKAKHITMRIIDLIMTGNLLFLMALQVTRQLAHEWIGIAMTVLFVVHHIFNYKYYKTIFKGKYNFFRVFQLLISVLLLASFVLTAFSGMTMSRFATPFMNGFLKASDARKIHLAISYWSYVLMGVHIGLHFGIITAKLPKGIFRTISAVIMTGISIWGFMLFLNANIFNYMFMQTHFAFLDYEKAAWLVILENFIMLISWAFTAYLLSLFIKSITAMGKKDKKKIVFTILYAVGIVVIMGVGTLMHFVTSGGSESSILAWNTPAGNTSQTAENDNSKIRTENGSPDNTEQNNTEVKDNYVLIEGGSFMMGSPETENWRISDETQHEVTLSDFYISAYEITQAEYLSVMGDNPSVFQGDSLPLENITWTQAVEFANKKSSAEGLTPVYQIADGSVTWNRDANGYRLPTEAEWEYACRAGTATPFNTQKSLDATQANFYGHYPYEIEENYFDDSVLEARPGEYRQTTVEVGSFEPNAWGLYDCHGNVNEWCWDFYGEYDTSDTNNPAGTKIGTRHIYRGGGWNDFGKNMRSAYRAAGSSELKSSNLGIRLVRNASKNELGKVTIKDESVKPTNTGKMLIVYYSWSGNTRGAAQEIQRQTGADIFEIELVEPYSADYNTVLMQAQEAQHRQDRPAISNRIDNMEQYDTIILGYPNWWASIPMPIATFLESYDLSGKTILPFCSHGGGRFGQSLTAISKLAPDSYLGEGLSIHYSGGSSLSDDVENWLKTNGIN